MLFLPEYQWLETYLKDDAFWLEDVITWESSYRLVATEHNLYSVLTSTFFTKTYFFIDSFVHLSFTDMWLCSESPSYPATTELFKYLMFDMMSAISVNFFFHRTFFCTDYHDYYSLILYNHPELVMAINSYLESYWFQAAMSHIPTSVFDIYHDGLSTVRSSAERYLTMFLVFMWVLIAIGGVANSEVWKKYVNPMQTRLMNYMFSFSREVRFDFVVTAFAFFLGFCYTSMMIATFDDDQEESIEFVDVLMFNLVLYIIGLYLYKLSVHCLSFFEPASSGNRSLTVVMSQVFRDLISGLSLLLRFLVLMARINIYDANDDILDSYYILVGDFDDDEYMVDTLADMSAVMSFDIDNNDDRSFLLEDETDMSGDLYSLYFVIWGKVALFYFFILEEIARMALAFYVTYLIIFEVNTTNRSFIEDQFVISKKS